MKGKQQLAEVNEKARNTPIGMLEGKRLVVKRIGKKKTVCSFFGNDISISNEMLNLE